MTPIISDLGPPIMIDDTRRERRYHARLPVEFQVRVVDEGGSSAIGRLVDISKSGISVLVPEALAAGSRVRVELSDAVLLGRVVYANPGSHTDSGAIAKFRLGIVLEQVLIGDSDLSHLLRTLLEDEHVTFPIVKQ